MNMKLLAGCTGDLRRLGPGKIIPLEASGGRLWLSTVMSVEIIITIRLFGDIVNAIKTDGFALVDGLRRMIPIPGYILAGNSRTRGGGTKSGLRVPR